eukprot:scaffold59241_cov57-Phaeocystis_antarctica.AAC.5
MATPPGIPGIPGTNTSQLRMHGAMCSSRSGAMSSSAACNRRAPLPAAASPRCVKSVVIADCTSQTPIARLYQVYASLNSPAASASFPRPLRRAHLGCT